MGLKTQDHISLAETGCWWPRAIDLGYDPCTGTHQLVGSGSVMPPSGTSTLSTRSRALARSTAGRNQQAREPHRGRRSTRNTFGGQHDVRLLPDNWTVLDNRTNLGALRAVRFRSTSRLEPRLSCSRSVTGIPLRLLWFVKPPGADGLIVRGGQGPCGRRLQAQWSEDFPLDLGHSLQLSGGAGPLGRGVGAESA